MIRRNYLKKGIGLSMAIAMIVSYAPVQAWGSDCEEVNAIDESVTTSFADLNVPLQVNAGNGHSAKVEAGDIKSGSSWDWDAVVVYASGENSSSTVTVNNVSSAESGVRVSSYNGSESKLTVKGDITSRVVGVNSDTFGGGTLNVDVKGSIEIQTAHEELPGEGIHAESRGNGNVNISVEEDIRSDAVGVNVSNQSSQDGSNVVFVGGTIEAKTVGVLVDANEEYRDNISVTAWKINPNADGVIAGYYDPDEKIVKDEGFEKNSIHYIIKVEQPKEGATLSTSGDSEPEREGIKVANEGQEVKMIASIEPGWVITAAYASDGTEIPITPNEKGEYIYKVPAGGGVYFHVELAHAPTPEPDPEPEPTPEPAPKITVRVEETSESKSDNDGDKTYMTIAQMIREAAPGGTVNAITMVGDSVDKTVADALKERPDVTLTLQFVYGGKMYVVTIPAGFDVDAIRNADGGIDFATLILVCGATEV